MHTFILVKKITFGSYEYEVKVKLLGFKDFQSTNVYGTFCSAKYFSKVNIWLIYLRGQCFHRELSSCLNIQRLPIFEGKHTYSILKNGIFHFFSQHGTPTLVFSPSPCSQAPKHSHDTRLTETQKCPDWWYDLRQKNNIFVSADYRYLKSWFPVYRKMKHKCIVEKDSSRSPYKALDPNIYYCCSFCPPSQGQ